MFLGQSSGFRGNGAVSCKAIMDFLGGRIT